VIGAGIAGVYSAWRLRAAGPDELQDDKLRASARDNRGRLDVGLFESDRRIGGRLYSKRMPLSGILPSNDPLQLPDVDDSVVELGGMRFTPEHVRVARLVEHFRLPTTSQYVDDKRRTNLYYLRGRRFRLSDWARPDFQPPYELDRGERGRTPGSLMIEVALRHFERLARHPEEYRNRGFWNLLYDELSSEAYRLVRDAGGYETIVGNWNAADAIPFLLADFGVSQGYSKLKTGFMSLPAAIHREFAGLGEPAYTGYRLRRLDFADDVFKLTFVRSDAAGYASSANPLQKTEPFQVSAKRVILAMPRRGIELLHPDSAIFKDDSEGKDFIDGLQAVTPQRAFKIFAAYRLPWWRTANGIRSGRSLTDLPVRQCFAWRTAQARDPNQASILMASYSDGSDVDFWRGLERQGGRYAPRPEDYPPGVAIPEPRFDDCLAPNGVVDELHDQLRELHGVTDVYGEGLASIVRPYYAVMKDWSVDPHGGGWHFWKIGVDSGRIMRRMRKPFSQMSLHVCGEAWSSQQGWVEGALETADEVLGFFLNEGARIPAYDE
jgi:hypothetical protein